MQRDNNNQDYLEKEQNQRIYITRNSDLVQSRTKTVQCIKELKGESETTQTHSSVTCDL